MLITGRTLFAFVDPKDPFRPSEIAGEDQPGPILSLMAARPFDFLFLFHTPHTRENAAATHDEVRHRYERCHVIIRELPVSDPKDYSGLMGRLAREVRQITRMSRGTENSVCVSSGTAEMRAAWFLLTAVGTLPATLLQVGSPAEPLFGPANVKEVRLDSGDWADLRDLVMPQEYFRGAQAARQSVQEARDNALGDAHAFAEIAERISALVEQLPERAIKQRPTAVPPAPSRPHDAAPEEGGVAHSVAPPDETNVPSDERVEADDRAAMLMLDLGRECVRVLEEARHLVDRARARSWENADSVTRWSDSALAAPARFAARLITPERPTPTPGLEEALQELGIFIHSATMREAAERAAIMAQSDLARVVLLQGETGTGKELFAKLIHRMSDRHGHGLVTVNCAVVQKDLAESLLFGHVRGAFTGATITEKASSTWRTEARCS